MVRRTDPPPTPEDPVLDDLSDAAPSTVAAGGSTSGTAPDLASFPVIGLTRRRMAAVLGVLLAAWIVVLFARQVGEASAASSRAEAMVVSNAAKRLETAGLERELDRIVQIRYVLQQARGYGLGSAREIPFTLGPDAPPLPADAPGSAAVRVGAISSMTPLERWLTLLFGPGS